MCGNNKNGWTCCLRLAVYAIRECGGSAAAFATRLTCALSAENNTLTDGAWASAQAWAGGAVEECGSNAQETQSVHMRAGRS